MLLPVVSAIALTGLWFAGMPGTGSGSDSLVVYCAHDSVYADAILKDFEKQSGIRVDVRYDTEATKSLGLVNLIVSERQRPRCDVFWNNELLGTVDLQAQGLLEPHKGTNHEGVSLNRDLNPPRRTKHKGVSLERDAHTEYRVTPKSQRGTHRVPSYA